MTSALAGDLVSDGNVFSEGFVSAFAVISSAARADFARSVADDPCRVADDLAVAVMFGGLSQSLIPLLGPRHFSLISLIDFSVVKCFPAITSIARRPRAASRL